MPRIVFACSLLSTLLLTALAAVAQTPAPSKGAEPTTSTVHAAFRQSLPFAERADFEDARRGFIAALPEGLVAGPAGRPAWNLQDYAFLQQEGSPTVNPSLWRQAQLNMNNGLFKVTDRLYQLRGHDISNMTVIEGDTGLIIIDPLLTTEVAKAALALYYQHRPRKPVVAVIYTHSHVDHFGGVKGVVAEAEVKAGKVQVIAPIGFMEEAVSENVLAGNAMSRRAQFQFGPLLPKGERGQVDAGLGKNVSRGSITLIPPTRLISLPTESLKIDGIDIVFMLTPGTEAPAEMIMYYPQLRALNMAENTAHLLHNLYPLRGAQVRDANVWAKYINVAIERYASQSDVLLAQHNWPTWGTARIERFLGKQRDLYKYIHDQTVRLMNHGYTGAEIAEQLKLPPSLANEWANRDYYGTVSHNAKAVYQRYLGWYDANPANLNPLPPVATAKKTVEYMGGAAAVLLRAREDFKKGEYRWVAQAMSQVVYADPANREARELGADALEQLGYQAESSTWRNAYLMGAQELRAIAPLDAAPATGSPDIVKSLPLDLYFDYLGVRLNGPKAEGKTIVLYWVFTDTQQRYVLRLDNSALTYTEGRSAPEANATVTLTRATLDAISLQQTSFPAALQDGKLAVSGDHGKLLELMSLFEPFPAMFPLLTPRP
ncbi:alkyl sulfatase dimerization domain-containing protein [soil metagenome]